MKLTILIILAYSNLIFADVVGNLVKLENPNPTRVLFIGNSYLYYNDSLHNHVRRMVEEKFPDKILAVEPNIKTCFLLTFFFVSTNPNLFALETVM